MKILWCWRCQQEVPMLETAESALVTACASRNKFFTRVYASQTNGMAAASIAAVEAEAERRGQKIEPPLVLKDYDFQRPMLEMYRLLTGFKETNPSAVFHHHVDLYGPPCPQCHKPLRTPEARFCAACGFGQEYVTADSLPLPQRRPELFTT